MYIARCIQCRNIIGAVRNPGNFTWLRCLECGTNNYITWAIDPKEQYFDPREKETNEKQFDFDSDARKGIKNIGIFG